MCLTRLHYVFLTILLGVFAAAAIRADPPPRRAATSQPQATSRPTARPASNTAMMPAARTDPGWIQRNESINHRAAQGDIDLIFLGDSITQGWETEGKAVWEKHYGQRKAANFGISGDRTQHVLWRLKHGNLDGLDKPANPGKATPRLVVLMIGTNNSNGSDNTSEEIAGGIVLIVGALREKLPQAKVLVLGIFPRNEKLDAQRAKNAQASELASRVADGKQVFYLDIGKKFLAADGTLPREIMPDLLHLSEKGYEIWAEAIEAKVAELLK